MLSKIRCACCAHVSNFFGSRGALILLLIDKFSLDTGNDIQFNTKYDNISIYIGSCPAVLHAHITL